MGKINFVALLYITAAGCLFEGGRELLAKIWFDTHAEKAVMTSTDPVLERTLKYNPTGSAMADVDYQTLHGTVPVHEVYLSPERVQKLARGEGIRLRYMKNEPQRYLEEGVELDSGIGVLIFGLVASGVAVFAHRLLRREAGIDD